jgi:hypothetical protein
MNERIPDNKGSHFLHASWKEPEPFLSKRILLLVRKKDGLLKE